MLTQPLQYLKKETPSHAVPPTKVNERVNIWVVEVVLHQPVMGCFVVLTYVALMLRPSCPGRGRFGGNLSSSSILVCCNSSITSSSIISMSKLDEDISTMVYSNEMRMR